MDFEALAELLVPLVFLVMVGGLVALRMLKPYGNRILELIREIQEDRHRALAETRDLQDVRDRLDMLAERQDFLESLVRSRLEGEGQAELERIRREELGPGAASPGHGETRSEVGEASGVADGDAGKDERAGSSGGSAG